jgi:hypothetical protein
MLTTLPAAADRMAANTAPASLDIVAESKAKAKSRSLEIVCGGCTTTTAVVVVVAIVTLTGSSGPAGFEQLAPTWPEERLAL